MTITTARRAAAAFRPIIEDLTERMAIISSSHPRTCPLESILKAVPGIVNGFGCRKAEV
jgi:hypothetical protein